jgi:two-component system chemotaxis response regulator CheY
MPTRIEVSTAPFPSVEPACSFPDASRGAGAGLEVLIVDDSPVTRRVLRRVMELSGLAVAQVHEAGDGAEALAQLAAHRVDLVLADVNMPTMDGVELLERMARDPGMAAIPVVVVATQMCQERLERLLRAGARCYLAKPFRPEALRDVVVQILGARAGRVA